MNPLKDSPTPTAPTEPTLDTMPKEIWDYYTITRWDGDNWVDTSDILSVVWTWRFISYLERDDGGVRIKGEYTLGMSNPSDNDVRYLFYKFTFEDGYGIPISEYSFSYIQRNVEANSTATYSGTFEIDLDNLDAANQITQLIILGGATIPR